MAITATAFSARAPLGPTSPAQRLSNEPEDKPWHLREFRVADLDDNQLRVFYDFSRELQAH
jgi:hypothetical protein